MHSLSTVLELGVVMGAALTLAERTKTTAVSTTCTPGTLPTVVLDVLTPTGHHRVPRVVVASLSTVLELGVDMETATTMDLAKISVAGSILSARKQHTMVPPALTATIISSASLVVAVSLWTALELGARMDLVLTLPRTIRTGGAEPTSIAKVLLTMARAAHTATTTNLASRVAAVNLLTVLELGALMEAAIMMAVTTRTKDAEPTSTAKVLPTTAMVARIATTTSLVPQAVALSQWTAKVPGKLTAHATTTAILIRIRGADAISTAQALLTVVMLAPTPTTTCNVLQVVAASRSTVLEAGAVTEIATTTVALIRIRDAESTRSAKTRLIAVMAAHTVTTTCSAPQEAAHSLWIAMELGVPMGVATTTPRTTRTRDADFTR